MDRVPNSAIDWNSTPFFGWAGLRLLEAEGGRARVELDVQDHHRGGGGTRAINGGIIAYMFDGLLGVAVGSTREDLAGQVTVSLNINYLRMVEAHSLVVGTARVLRQGRELAFAEGQILGEDGEICATCTGVFRTFHTPLPASTRRRAAKAK